MKKQQSIAGILRKCSKFFIAFVSIGTGIGGAVFGYSEYPFPITHWGHKNGNDVINAIIFAAIGVVVGLLVSFLLSIFVLYLAELGENTKKTADAAVQSAKMNSVDDLKKYKELLDSGLITNEEYEAKKKQILNL